MPNNVIPFPQPDPDDDPDPVEELAKIGRAFKERTGLNADEAAAYIMAQIRDQPIPEAILAKLRAATPDPSIRTLIIRYTLTQTDGRWSMEDRDGLGLSGSADDDATPAQHVRAFLEDLLFAWDHYAVAPDAKLTSDAQELKRRLLGLFGLEAEEDKT